MPVRRAEWIESLAEDVLQMILMPTEGCNFRCTYCYEDFKIGRMHPEIVEGLKRLLSRRASRLRCLTLSWFGGEPLLARDIVEDVLTHARSLTEEHPGLELRSDITTNGYTLSRPVFERLLDLGVTTYQVSLDGPAFWHDRQRVRANGGPTFGRIWGNLLAMRAVPRPYTVTLRLHVDCGNVDLMPDFIDEIAVHFAADDRFRVFVRPLSRFGGRNDAKLRVLDDDAGRARLVSLRRHVEKRGLRLHVPEATSSICYAARINSLVVRADGRLGKCTLALEHPRNQVGRLHPDGSLQLEIPRIEKWARGLVTMDPEELRCPMLRFADPRPTREAARRRAVVVPRCEPVPRRTAPRRRAS